MLKILLTTCLILHFMIPVEELPAFTIQKNRLDNTLIVLPSEDNDITDDAAKCLNYYIKKSMGKKITIKKENNLHGENEQLAVYETLIVLGNTEMAISNGIDITEIESDGYILKTVKNKLFILGVDKKWDISDSSSETMNKRKIWNLYEAKRGTLNGVIGFLRDFCGVRWFLPTTEGEKIPKLEQISVPDHYYTKSEPAFECAFGYAGKLRAYRPGKYWYAANSFRIPINYLHLGGHSWDQQIELHAKTPSKLFNNHPEYFSLIKGKRRLKKKSQLLCTSNAQVVNFLTETIGQIFNLGWGMIQYGQSDGYRRCECSKCELLDRYRNEKGIATKNPCERLWLPALQIANRVYESHPDKKILMMVYNPSRTPTEKIDRFPANVRLMLCNQERKDFDGWRDKAEIFGVWLYWFGEWNPGSHTVTFSPKSAAERIRFFHRQGVKMLYWGSGKGGQNSWGNEGPVYYVIGQLVRDPYKDYNQLLNEYYSFLYGQAANDMKKYYDLLYKRIDEVYIPDFEAKETIKTSSDFFTSIYPADVLEELSGHLESAKNNAKTDKSKNWIKLVSREFSYIENTATIYHLYGSYQETLDVAYTKKINKLKSDREKLFDKLVNIGNDEEYTKNWYPGYDETLPFILNGGKNRGKLVSPF